MFTGNSGSERLQSWRDMRNKQFDTAEELVLEFPYANWSSRFIDFYTPSTWPGIFEIVSDGHSCQSGITLIMATTLYSAGFISGDELTFPVISNNTNGNTGLVLFHNNLVYNFAQGRIVSFQEVKDNSTIYTTHVVKIKQLFS